MNKPTTCREINIRGEYVQIFPYADLEIKIYLRDSQIFPARTPLSEI